MNKVESVEQMELRQLKAGIDSLIKKFLTPQLESAIDVRNSKDDYTKGAGHGMEIVAKYTIDHLKELMERGF